ncbi:MAG: 50S ribosomal protein L4 [SAR202 cluster bacterium]|nr:50S ribosomal protein L4 [SAR202 cluster bacterium]
MELPVRNIKGEEVSKLQVSDAVFGAPLNNDLLHQALVFHSANQRLGTSNTLTRDEVSGGGKKPYPQKHTGRARQGSIRSPQWRHGGIVFGPHPRSYRTHLPKRMRRGAIRAALSGKAATGRLIVVDSFDALEAKTKAMASALGALGVTSSALVILREPNMGVVHTVRNLPRTKTLAADLLNVLDLLRYDAVVMTVDAVKRAEELWSRLDVPRGKAAAGREA